MFRKTMYLDDMLVKSEKSAQHIEHLGEMFQVLRSYNMKLNPLKCAFGAKSRKFFGFIISSWGIKANPKKIKALFDMESPKKLKEVQKLTGCVTTLNRFICKSIDKCMPFFDILRGNEHFEWIEECETTF